MSKTNTRKSSYEKGNDYEKFVTQCLEEAIKQNKLPIPMGQCKIIRNKTYRIPAGNDIEVDIAIEVYRDGAQDPFFIIIIECKDYNSPIDTLRLNDLITKKELISAHKAILITTSRFERGVIQQAQFKKIALAQLKPTDKDITWTLDRKSTSSKQLFKDIISSNNLPPVEFIGIDNENAYLSLDEFLISSFRLTDFVSAPYISPKEIENETLRLIHDNDIIYKPNLQNAELRKVLFNAFHFTCWQLDVNDPRLGVCDFRHRKVLYSPTLKLNSHRWRFTIAHEIGHIVLHKKHFNNTSTLEDNEDTVNLLKNSATLKRIEYQANLFASLLLIPQSIFLGKYIEMYNQLDLPKTNFPKIYVDNQKTNNDDFNNLVSILSGIFNVSKEVITYRMKYLNLIDDHRQSTYKKFDSLIHQTELYLYR